jgi:hypothetical protein
VQVFPVQPGFRVVNHTVTDSESQRKNVYTHHLYGISSLKRLDSPLLIVRYMCHGLLKQTYKPSPLSERRGRSTTHRLRVLMNIQVGLAVKVLDFVDSWLQFSIFEDG